MFTGIVTGLGRILAVDALGPAPGHGKRLTFEASARLPRRASSAATASRSMAPGMTATTVDAAARRFCVDISAESLARTAAMGDPRSVNLEKALRATTASADISSAATSTPGP